MDSVFQLGGAVMGNRNVQTVRTKLMQSVVSCCALTYKQTHQSMLQIQTQLERGRSGHMFGLQCVLVCVHMCLFVKIVE